MAAKSIGKLAAVEHTLLRYRGSRRYRGETGRSQRNVLEGQDKGEDGDRIWRIED